MSILLNRVSRLGIPDRLDSRIGWSIGLLVVVSSVVLAHVLVQAAQREIEDLSRANMVTLGQQMARELSSGMDRFAREIQVQAQRSVFRDPQAGTGEIRAELEQLQSLHPELSYVALVDAAAARVVAATGGIFEGGDARGRPVFDEGLKGPFLGDVHDAVRLAELLPRPASGEPLRFLDVSAPVRDADGQVIRVMAAHVSWQWTAMLREQVLGPVQQRRGVEIVLVNTAGKVVLSGVPGVQVGDDLAPLLAGSRSDRAESVDWADGAGYLTVVEPTHPQGRFPGFGWKVVVRQSNEVVSGPIDRLRAAFFAGALLLGGLGAVLASAIARRLMRPVRLLADAAEQVGDDGDVSHFHESSLPGEVSSVQNAMVRLAGSAQAHAQAAAAKGRQFTALAESLPDVVWQADAGGRFEYANRAWLRSRPGEEDLRVEHLAELVREDDRAGFAAAWSASCQSGADLSVRCRVVLPGSRQERWFDISGRAVRADDGSVLRWVGTLSDVHEVMRVAENAERALALERSAREEAERLARMKDEFLATVSHELRSPLSAIAGWSDILTKNGALHPLVAQAAEVIRRNTRLQAGLINDLIDLSAVIGGKLVLSLSPMDLAAAVHDGVQSHLKTAEAKGIALVCTEAGPVMVHADSVRIAQVISNLVANALKFTKAGGRVTVSTFAEGDEAVVRVTDTGRGIAPEFLPFVFERMRQEDASTTRRHGGLGLGLAIAKGMVELHLGSIRAESSGAGWGSTFTVRLPLLAPEASSNFGLLDAADEEGDPESGLRGLRILVVEDEADARDVLQVALTSLGASVQGASSGFQALALLRELRFDVLLSDIGMPDMDGFGLMRAVRELPGCSAAELPCIAVTAFVMESDKQAARKVGFQAYVAKPISIRRLSEAVAQAMEASRNARSEPHS